MEQSDNWSYMKFSYWFTRTHTADWKKKTSILSQVTWDFIPDTYGPGLLFFFQIFIVLYETRPYVSHGVMGTDHDDNYETALASLVYLAN